MVTIEKFGDYMQVSSLHGKWEGCKAEQSSRQSQC